NLPHPASLPLCRDQFDKHDGNQNLQVLKNAAGTDSVPTLHSASTTRRGSVPPSPTHRIQDDGWRDAACETNARRDRRSLHLASSCRIVLPRFPDSPEQLRNRLMQVLHPNRPDQRQSRSYTLL